MATRERSVGGLSSAGGRCRRGDPGSMKRTARRAGDPEGGGKRRELPGPDWASLLPEVLLRVFQHLPLLDRARASQVCRGWQLAFHLPELWRRFEFELGQPGATATTHPELIKQILKRHAGHLQYVSFKVRPRRLGLGRPRPCAASCPRAPNAGAGGLL